MDQNLLYLDYIKYFEILRQLSFDKDFNERSLCNLKILKFAVFGIVYVVLNV